MMAATFVPTIDSEGLLAWNAEDQIPVEMYTRLQDHPCFGLAAHTLSCNMLNLADENTALDGIFKDAGRYVASMWAMYLHFSVGLTLPRLKQLCLGSGLLSTGRARAVLLLLRHLRMLEPARERPRGAPTHYVPTARFIQAWRRYLEAALEAASVIEPGAQYLAEKLAQRETFESFARLLGKGYLAASRKVDHRRSAFARVFLHRHAGMQIIHLLLKSSRYEGTFPPERAMLPSVAVMAKRLRVSRTHLNRMLGDAEREGLIRRDGECNVILSAEMQWAVRWVISSQLLAVLVCAAKCEQEHRHLSDRTASVELMVGRLGTAIGQPGA